MIKKRERFWGHLEGRSSKTSGWPEGEPLSTRVGTREETAASAPRREARRQEDEGACGLWYVEGERLVVSEGASRRGEAAERTEGKHSHAAGNNTKCWPHANDYV